MRTNGAVQPPFKRPSLYWRNPVALLPWPSGAPSSRPFVCCEDVMRLAAKVFSRGAICAVALSGWMYSPQLAAEENAAHQLADKFSRAAEEGARADEAKKAEARAKAKAQAEAKAEAEAKQRAETKALAERKAAEQRAADEAEMMRAVEEEAESRRREQFAREEQQRIENERRAARAEAQRMAEEAQKQSDELQRQAEEKRRAEAERLTQEVEARRLADEKRADEERGVAEDKRRAEEARVAEEKRKAEETRVAEEKRRAEEARVAEEKRQAEEKRIAEIRRQAEEAEKTRIAEERRVAELKRQAQETENRRRAEEARLVEQTRRAEEEARVAEQRRIKEIEDTQQRTALEVQREEEARRIAEKFRLARELREARAAEARERERETRNSLGGPATGSDLSSPFFDEPPVTAAATYPQRVTVLVIMQPRRHGFGGKRMTANPVLCVGDSCYVSNGAGAMASLMRRGQALGPGNTLGRNAGVCRNDTTCVYRGVTLPGPMATIQPVDMGFLRHDRREIRNVEADRTCTTTAGALSCSTPVVTSGYRAWIVPEAVAEAAGASGLERVLNEGLPAARSASYGDWKSTVQVLPTR
jgi:hypothetical protein